MSDEKPSIDVVDMASEDWQGALLSVAQADPALWQALSRYLAVTLVNGRLGELALPAPVDVAVVLEATAMLPEELRALVAEELAALPRLVMQHDELVEDGALLYLAVMRKLRAACRGARYDLIERLVREVMASPEFDPQPGDLEALLARMALGPEAALAAYRETARQATETAAREQATQEAAEPETGDVEDMGDIGGERALVAMGARVRRMQWAVGLVACCAVVLLAVMGVRGARAEARAESAQAEAREAREAARESERRARLPIEVRLDEDAHGERYWPDDLPVRIDLGDERSVTILVPE